MMTFEEYKRLAQNPPKKEQETIFVLSCTEVEELPERCRQHYPEYELRHAYNMAYCHTLEEAEAIMRQDATQRDKQNDFEVFCYEIKERAVNQKLRECTTVSYRIYDGEGCFLDKVMCACGCMTHEDSIYGVYRGRTQEQMRFRPGDIVEFVTHGDKVALGFVVGQPLTIEECWKIEQRSRERYQELGIDEDKLPYYCGLDDSEDCYIVLETSSYISHHHVHITRIFAPHYPIPPYLRKKFERAYQRFVERKE